MLLALHRQAALLHISSEQETLPAQNILFLFPIFLLQVNEFQGIKGPVNPLYTTFISAFSSVNEARKLLSPESSIDCYVLQDSKVFISIASEAQVFHCNAVC